MGICKFVDSIAAAPTTRFDFYRAAQGVTLLRNGTRIGMPSLDRSVTASPLSDGFHVGSSTYGARVLTLRVRFAAANVDTLATQMQLLNRELDRETNWLMWQPDGATKPVFFKTYRSAPVEVDMEEATATGWEYGLELLADPFALGLRETLGPFTVNNDPAHASNGLFVDVTGVIGDVPARAVIQDTSGLREFTLLAVRQHGTPSDHAFFRQAESCTLGLNTTNPGGGPDAVMSGTGTNNFVRTNDGGVVFDEPQTRLTWDLSATHTTTAQRLALAGAFRVMVVMRTPGLNTNWGGVRAKVGEVTGSTVRPGTSFARRILDLGVFTYQDLVTPGLSVEAPADASFNKIEIQSSNTSGSGADMDWDFIALIPADEGTLMWANNAIDTTSYDVLIDGENERVMLYTNGGNPFDGTAALRSTDAVNESGGYLSLVPNQTNRVYVLTADYSVSSHSFMPMVKTTSEALTFNYWPRYLHVRPVTT